jgi:hypothetical protein
VVPVKPRKRLNNWTPNFHLLGDGLAMTGTLCAGALAAMEEQSKSNGNPPLGDAKRIGVETSMFTVQAYLLLRALIEYSQSPDVIAAEFLVELVKCGNPGDTIELPDPRICKRHLAFNLLESPLLPELEKHLTNSLMMTMMMNAIKRDQRLQ